MEFRGSAFKLFPEELWDLILDQLPAQEIQNIYAAYPEMKLALKNRKHLWLFDQVLPLLTEWLTAHDLLRCRLVSKLWSQGVDNFLENLPSKRAYTDAGPSWKLKTRSISFSRALSFQHNIDPFIFLYGGGYFRRSYSFQSFAKIDEFLQDMKTETLRRERNPFVGRSIKVNRYPRGSAEYNELYWSKVLHFLNLLGEHVWFIKIWEFIQGDKVQFVGFLQQAFWSLPNLKSLNIEGNGEQLGRWDFSDGAVEFKKLVTSFPKLPQLETLKLDGCFPELVETFVEHYFPQIRRLVWYMRDFRLEWKNEYGNRLDNLTELVLVLPAGTVVARVKQMLISLRAPMLNRLHVHFQGNRQLLVEYHQVEIKDFLGNSGGCPKLRHFHFHDKETTITRR